jgi:hypothetical protein
MLWTPRLPAGTATTSATSPGLSSTTGRLTGGDWRLYRRHDSRPTRNVNVQRDIVVLVVDNNDNNIVVRLGCTGVSRLGRVRIDIMLLTRRTVGGRHRRRVTCQLFLKDT